MARYDLSRIPGHSNLSPADATLNKIRDAGKLVGEPEPKPDGGYVIGFRRNDGWVETMAIHPDGKVRWL